ncbi:MAG: hypothetical protein JSW12_08705, partial [Deltaproteobacteria bacterium]
HPGFPSPEKATGFVALGHERSDHDLSMSELMAFQRFLFPVFIMSWDPAHQVVKNEDATPLFFLGKSSTSWTY